MSLRPTKKQELDSLRDRLRRETRRSQRLERAIQAVIDTFTHAVAEYDRRTTNPGGQHVTYFGDFSVITPSTAVQFRRWIRDLNDALQGRWPLLRADWQELFPDTSEYELDKMFGKAEPEDD